MELSEIGFIINKYWYEIPQHFRFAKLDAFIIMPNHIHGIIIVTKNTLVETPNLGVSTDNNGNTDNTVGITNTLVEMPNLGVSTDNNGNTDNYIKTDNIVAIKTKKWKSGSFGCHYQSI